MRAKTCLFDEEDVLVRVLCLPVSHGEYIHPIF